MMFIKDLLQAVIDLGVVLFLTLILLAVLFFAGLWLKRRALNIQIAAQEVARYVGGNRQERAMHLNYSASFWQGISTELFGAVITTLAFGVVLLVFQQYQSIQNHKSELILQMGSPENAFAIEAIRQLNALGWLGDGSLQGAWLQGANLEGANLGHSNLQGADLEIANLQGAWLQGIHLQRADISQSNLQGAYLENANLQGADLLNADLRGAILCNVDLGWRGADLQDAQLQGARLEGTNLCDSNLQGADLTGVAFSVDTLLPDAGWNSELQGYAPYWTPETDMTRYTDPRHPEFWQPDWVTE